MPSSRSLPVIFRPSSTRFAMSSGESGPPYPDRFCRSHHGWCVGAGSQARDSASLYPKSFRTRSYTASVPAMTRTSLQPCSARTSIIRSQYGQSAYGAV